jgi:hypothetical protein
MSKRNAQENRRRRQLSIHIPEATGKKVRKLSIEGPPDSGLNDFGVSISFEDDTHIFIEFSALLRTQTSYERTVRGELRRIKEYSPRVLE